MSDAPKGVSERMLSLSGFPEQVQAAMNLVQVCSLIAPCTAFLAVVHGEHLLKVMSADVCQSAVDL